MLVTSPLDIVALAPYMLGYQPQDSIAVIKLREDTAVVAGNDRCLGIAAANADTIHRWADGYAEKLARQDGDTTVIIGYGAAAPVEALCAALRSSLEDHDVPVARVLRVSDDRIYRIAGPDDCPGGGIPYAPGTATTAVTAAAGKAGLAPPLPDRDALVALVAPVQGPAAQAMATATAAALTRLFAIVRTPRPGGCLPADVEATARDAVTEACRIVSRGEELTDDHVAWLIVLLSATQLRNVVVTMIADAAPRTRVHQRLWADVTRRAGVAWAVTPGNLLALAANHAGHGTLAGIAVDRVLCNDPADPYAHALNEALYEARPPGPWLTDLFRGTGLRTRRRG